ncbi:MAG: DNA-deoxyinosine glycosylase [Solobacterium sp.]|nr:DNA-deoxyinosine glycosylase [Solobacterium sp.]
MNERLSHTLKPVFDSDSRILILGSFPSAVSRKLNFYYANPTNRFWPVLSRVFDETIDDRREFCLRRNIALWDVIESCTITGSSDSSIRDVKVNDIQSLIEQTKIHAVFTTGGKAASLYRRYVHADLQATALPSTSAANASMRLERLTEIYAILRETLEKD